MQQNTLFGATTITRPCSACRGTGKIISEPCSECRGKGRVRRLKRLTLKVPAGIDDGQTINMRNEGDAGYKGGPRGNLYVTISVRPHSQFVRRGSDLLLTMNIPYTIAVLGGEIVVPTLTGQIKYNIPAGTQIGTTFRLREQGIRAGVVRIRYMRPFPNAEIAAALQNAKAFGVLEKDVSFGNEGTVYTNVNSALQKAGVRIPGYNFIGGLGGRNISAGDIAQIFADIQDGTEHVNFIGIGGDCNGKSNG
jgi:hypothetical protein